MKVFAAPKELTKKEFVITKIKLLDIILNLYKYFMKDCYCFSIDIHDLIQDTGYSIEKIKLMLETTDAHLTADPELNQRIKINANEK